MCFLLWQRRKTNGKSPQAGSFWLNACKEAQQLQMQLETSGLFRMCVCWTNGFKMPGSGYFLNKDGLHAAFKWQERWPPSKDNSQIWKDYTTDAISMTLAIFFLMDGRGLSGFKFVSTSEGETLRPNNTLPLGVEGKEDYSSWVYFNKASMDPWQTVTAAMSTVTSTFEPLFLLMHLSSIQLQPPGY